MTTPRRSTADSTPRSVPDRWVPGAYELDRRRHPAVAREPRRSDRAVLRVHRADGARDRPAPDAGGADHRAAPRAPGRSRSRATSRPPDRDRGSRCSNSSPNSSSWCAESCRCRGARRSGCGTATRARPSRKLPAGLRGSVDVLVVDVFGGARIPAHVTSVEFYRECAEFLAPDGRAAGQRRRRLGRRVRARARRRRCSMVLRRCRRAGRTAGAEGAALRQLRAGRLALPASPRVDAAAARPRTAPRHARARPRTEELDRRGPGRHRRHRRPLSSPDRSVFQVRPGERGATIGGRATAAAGSVGDMPDPRPVARVARARRGRGAGARRAGGCTSERSRAPATAPPTGPRRRVRRRPCPDSAGRSRRARRTTWSPVSRARGRSSGCRRP